MKRNQMRSRLFKGARAARPLVAQPAGSELISSMQSHQALGMATPLRTDRAIV